MSTSGSKTLFSAREGRYVKRGVPARFGITARTAHEINRAPVPRLAFCPIRKHLPRRAGFYRVEPPRPAPAAAGLSGRTRRATEQNANPENLRCIRFRAFQSQ